VPPQKQWLLSRLEELGGAFCRATRCRCPGGSGHPASGCQTSLVRRDVVVPAMILLGLLALESVALASGNVNTMIVAIMAGVVVGLCIAVWVWFDHRATRSQFGSNLVSDSPWGWIIGVIFCARIALPWYLVRRYQQRQPSAASQKTLAHSLGRRLASRDR